MMTSLKRVIFNFWFPIIKPCLLISYFIEQELYGFKVVIRSEKTFVKKHLLSILGIVFRYRLSIIVFYTFENIPFES